MSALDGKIDIYDDLDYLFAIYKLSSSQQDNLLFFNSQLHLITPSFKLNVYICQRCPKIHIEFAELFVKSRKNLRAKSGICYRCRKASDNVK